MEFSNKIIVNCRTRENVRLQRPQNVILPDMGSMLGNFIVHCNKHSKSAFRSFKAHSVT